MSRQPVDPSHTTPLPAGVAYRVAHADGTHTDVPSTPRKSQSRTGATVGRVANGRAGAPNSPRGSSLTGSRAHPAWATREVARRVAHGATSDAGRPLTRAEKRRARSRRRAARHRNLGGAS